MLKRLIIAEKQSACEAIAKVLHITGKKDGYLESPDAIVSWYRGHLIATARPDVYGEKYEKWNLDTLPILPDNWQDIPLTDSGGEETVQNPFRAYEAPGRGHISGSNGRRA